MTFAKIVQRHAFLLLFVLIGCPQFATAQNDGGNLSPIAQISKITVKDAGRLGGDVQMVTQVFKPAGIGPFPVLLFSHGRAADAFSRSSMKFPIPLGHARYWLQKGFAVVAPIRFGYGIPGAPIERALAVTTTILEIALQSKTPPLQQIQRNLYWLPHWTGCAFNLGQKRMKFCWRDNQSVDLRQLPFVQRTHLALLAASIFPVEQAAIPVRWEKCVAPS